ncbi:MAG: polysaccharide deacetylase family protein [Gammaproteobacteria bacterium]|nr:polysaccharide deacetylase family protein [Gammaproteobacteria bacterium]
MNKPHLSILMYHQVGEFKNITRLKVNYCQVTRFEQQMSFLSRWGYSVISLTQAIRGLMGTEEIPPHSVVITFDDGYENFYQYAYPILKKYGFPATVYVVAGELGGMSDWLAEGNMPAAQLMNLEQIRNIQQGGVEIGSHAVHHYRLTRLGDTEIKNEIESSKKILEEHLQKSVDHVCYPYGDHNEKVVEVARLAGYISGVTTIKGSATSEHDALALPRKAISFRDNRYRFWRNLHFKHGETSENIIINPILG